MTGPLEAFKPANPLPIGDGSVKRAHLDAGELDNALTAFTEAEKATAAAGTAIPGLHLALGECLAQLERYGHRLRRADRWSTEFGRAQMIYRMNGGYVGASDRRTDGQAVGF